ncbi:hypothetical protein BDW72DRAFT_172168 [Aspergillus terricola var. indicus]
MQELQSQSHLVLQCNLRSIFHVHVHYPSAPPSPRNHEQSQQSPRHDSLTQMPGMCGVPG